MGFAAVVGHTIMLLGILTAGQAFASAYWNVTEHVDVGRDAQAARMDLRFRTNLTVMGTPTWTPVVNTYVFNVRNTGQTTLRVSEVDFVVDGRYRTTSVFAREVDGNAVTGVWLPGETLWVQMTGISAAPTRLLVASGPGAVAMWPR